jgi:hypothetical protein
LCNRTISKFDTPKPSFQFKGNRFFIIVTHIQKSDRMDCELRDKEIISGAKSDGIVS